LIAAHDDDVAWLGGWRGDRLFLSERGGAFRPVADLGWDPVRQSAPQRRVVLTGDALFVLEPARGPVLLPPLRVRRFDRDGRERGAEEKAKDGDAFSDRFVYFHLEPKASPSYSSTLCGLDPADGRPIAATGTLDLEVRGRRQPVSGTPVRHDGVLWYPVRMEGLVRDRALLRGEPGSAQVVDGACVCAGVGGLWVDGRWTRVPGMGRVFARWRPPLGRTVAAAPGGGLVVLRPRGGRLPVLGADGQPTLPPGAYSDLVARPDGLFAISSGDEPAWAPVRF